MKQPELVSSCVCRKRGRSHCKTWDGADGASALVLCRNLRQEHLPSPGCLWAGAAGARTVAFTPPTLQNPLAKTTVTTSPEGTVLARDVPKPQWLLKELFILTYFLWSLFICICTKFTKLTPAPARHLSVAPGGGRLLEDGGGQQHRRWAPAGQARRSRHSTAQLPKPSPENRAHPGASVAGQTTAPSLPQAVPGTGRHPHPPWLSRLMSITPCLTFMCRLRLPFRLNLLEQ